VAGVRFREGEAIGMENDHLAYFVIFKPTILQNCLLF
jgi:hypothetical protein